MAKPDQQDMQVRHSKLFAPSVRITWLKKPSSSSTKWHEPNFLARDGVDSGLCHEAEAQRRLVELRDDGRALNLDPWPKWSSQWKLSTSAVSKESLSLRKDRNHLELGFLQRSLDDEMHTLQSLQQMNASFQAFHADMEANTELLLHQRKELIGQVSKERELSRQDARQNNELRNLLERRRREQAALVSGHTGHKEPLTPPDSAAQANPSGTQSPRAAVISNAHTWASFLSQPGASEKDKATTR
ncbi:CARNS1 [Symbiodinium sp. CCMP2592]|nr:CARNS1 [Symbiodinium sp. CCMP2592]